MHRLRSTHIILASARTLQLSTSQELQQENYEIPIKLIPIVNQNFFFLGQVMHINSTTGTQFQSSKKLYIHKKKHKIFTWAFEIQKGKHASPHLQWHLSTLPSSRFHQRSKTQIEKRLLKAESCSSALELKA
ncbi:hypothetical protein V6Z12_A09G220500 [Gossypium hirsutum]